MPRHKQEKRRLRKPWNWTMPFLTFGNKRHSICGSVYVSGKLPTYPYPKPTFCSKWEGRINVILGEGQVDSFPETYIDPYLPWPSLDTSQVLRLPSATEMPFTEYKNIVFYVCFRTCHSAKCLLKKLSLICKKMKTRITRVYLKWVDFHYWFWNNAKQQYLPLSKEFEKTMLSKAIERAFFSQNF